MLVALSVDCGGAYVEAQTAPLTRETASTDSEPAVRPMQEIVVLGQRTDTDLARAAQKDAENIVNVLSYKEMRSLPVINAGDAVRSIPGVQLETDTGEGRFVNIRGLDSDLSSTTFGGVRLPPTDVTTSPYGGSRAVSFDALPSEMIGAITVTKTNRPEQEAEALGGTIDITPKTVPTDGNPYFGDIRLGSGLEPLRGTHVKDVAATVGGRFGENGSGYAPFSAIAVLSLYDDARGVDDLEELYTDQQPNVPDKAQLYWEQRYYRQHKKRHVYGAELGYSPDAGNKWFVRYYDFGVVQDYNRNALYFPLTGNPTVNADGSFSDVTGTDAAPAYAQKYYRSTKETFDTRLAQIGGSNDLGWVKLDYWVAHTQGLYNKPFDYKPIWQLSAYTNLTYNNTNANFPSISVTGGANPYDYSGYTLAQFTNSTQRSVTKDWSGKFNLAMPTHWTGYATEELKFGVGARKRKFDQNVDAYNATSVPALPLLPALEAGSGVRYYDGRYDMGRLIAPGYIPTAFANGSGAGFANNPQADLAQGALSTYSVEEDVYAAYGQYQFGFGKLGLFTGVRAEHTKERFDAFAVNTNNQIAPISSDHSYTDLLPSLQARYEFSPALIGRAIYSETIARPGYNQLSPALNINIPGNLVSLGDPNLKPTHSHNIDLSIENYLPHAGVVSVGMFYKDLKDYIVPLRTNETFPSTGIFAGISGPIPVITFANGSAARILGTELEVTRRFLELPGFWSAFGASANWTNVSSRIQIRPGDFTSLPSTARNTGNAALFYETPIVSARIGLNYISRSIFAIGGSLATDVYSEARTSLDFGAKWSVIDALSVYFDAKNLTNTPLKFAEGQSSRPIQRESYGKTFLAGFVWTF